MGFLGTSASASSDLSLLAAVALGSVALYAGAQVRRRNFSRHCPVMASAALLNLVPILYVMAQSLPGFGATYPPWVPGFLPLVHGGYGLLVQSLMLYTVARMYWLRDLPPSRPVGLMRATLVLWLLNVAGGALLMYPLAYVL